MAESTPKRCFWLTALLAVLILAGCSRISGDCHNLALAQAEAEEAWGVVLTQHAEADEVSTELEEEHELLHTELTEARAAVIVATARASAVCGG